MTRFLLTRVLEMVPVILGVSVAAFLVIHLVPGDPARLLLGFRATPDAVAALNHRLGLDRPLPIQYWEFVSHAVRLDFGDSLSSADPVGATIARGSEPSLLLVLYSLLLTGIIAVPLATIAAARRGGVVDQVIRVLTTVTFVMPGFWLGLLLIELASLRLGLLPTSGYGGSMTEHLTSLTLPALTTALGLAPLVLRQLRSNVIDTLGAEHVEAARARGLGTVRILRRHVVRNSVMSTVTLFGILAGVLLSVNVIVENVFSIPGLGTLLVAAVAQRDYPIVQALTLIFGLAVVAASLLTDLSYALLDPRVRL